MSASRILSECPTIQRPLGELFAANANMREPLPHLEFTLSDLNAGMLQMEVSPGGGKTRSVQARWVQPLPESVVETGNSITTCEATEQYGDSTKTYELSLEDTYQVNQKISAVDLATHCQDNSRYVLESINRLGVALEKKVASSIATQAAAQIGKWGVDAEDYFTITDDALQIATLLANGDINPKALQQIQQAARMAQYPSGLVAFGGATMQEYAMMIMAGCCTNGGIDLSAILQQYGFSFNYDKRVANAFGSQNDVLITTPGATQLLSYNLALWNSGIADSLRGGSGYARNQIFLPSGLPVDLFMKDSGCGDLDIVMTFTGKLASLPDDLYDASTDEAGIKFLNQVKVVNPS